MIEYVLLQMPIPRQKRSGERAFQGSKLCPLAQMQDVLL
jgi:hypothetical protein